MQLQHLTWSEVEDYLKRRQGIILPIGSTEQHGPTGMIGTDAICAEILAGRAADVGDTAETIVAPTIAFGQAQFNLSFPGTISLRARTLMNVVRDVVDSLAGQGFTHFYFVNGHGGNIAPLQAAFQDIYLDHQGDSALRCRVRSWWDHEEVRALTERLFAEWEGLHATPSEISITQAVLQSAGHDARRPDGMKPLDPAFVRNHAGDNHFGAAAHRASFPDGRVGSDPWRANPEAGAELVETAAGAIAADFENFLSE